MKADCCRAPLAFSSAPTVQMSRLRGQGQLGGSRLPGRSCTPRRTRLEPRARYDDRNGGLNTETRRRSLVSGGRHSHERDEQGPKARDPRVVCAPHRLPEGSGTCLCQISRHTGPHSAPCQHPACSEGLWPRRHRGPGCLWPPSRGQSGPFTSLACDTLDRDVRKKVGYNPTM